LATANKSPSSQFHHRREDPKEKPCFDETNVTIASRLASRRMNAPTTRDQHGSLTGLLAERRQMAT
jgi:hypothetical protein